MGGTVGGIIGGLAVLGSAVGASVGILVLGPILAAAMAGGLLGGLIGHGVPEEEAKRLHDEIHRGRTMIAVHVHEPREIRIAQHIFESMHGEALEALRPRAG
jgi:hypothetical protein